MASIADVIRFWIIVKCPHCGKFVCEAAPGSVVKVLCNRCKKESVTNVAA